ncbi:MvaI/BcnI family restriction endonuclease [Pseudarthrobacter enclensis]|uniref:MvaI/BcnI family restriction endonuclease n=1 Tax=Pseudarthrobacter enclensis TaxID=993070 RepID=UPI00130E83F0|nr:MvaI/BcnI family restriction endonuclease [Pseudarthrobacter enclensis]
MVSRHAPAASYLQQFNQRRGKLAEISLRADDATSRDVLFDQLRLIHAKNWIESYRLRPDGSRDVCKGPNCHGVTLESELGITANGRAAPDYLDWEVKAHRVNHLNAHFSSRITLLTPNPDSGEARTADTTWLAQTYGKLSPSGSRYDLSGIHRAGVLHEGTGLEFGLFGFDPVQQKIIDDGYLYLRDPGRENNLGRWSFSKLLTHWQTKHAKAVFVPCVAQGTDPDQFAFGTRIYVGEGTSFLRFLAGVSSGAVVLDPGLNTKLANNVWKAHTRYQFRSSLTNAPSLYRSFEKIIL